MMNRWTALLLEADDRLVFFSSIWDLWVPFSGGSNPALVSWPAGSEGDHLRLRGLGEAVAVVLLAVLEEPS